MMYDVYFKSHGKTVSVLEGQYLLDATIQAGIPIESNCGGAGNCKKCMVEIWDSQGTFKKTKALGCRYRVNSNIQVTVPRQKDAFERKTCLGTNSVSVALAPKITKQYKIIEKPTLNHQCADYEGIVKSFGLTLGNPHPELLKEIPKVLQKTNGGITAVIENNTLLWLESGDTTKEIHGLVFDIGTTTVVAHLVDITTGKVIHSVAATNPQNPYGADVIARIHHVGTTADGGKDLQKRILHAMEELIAAIIKKTGNSCETVYEITVVGNTTMMHLLMAVDPWALAQAPFTPCFTSGLSLDASRLMKSPNPITKMVLLPNIAGYIGADTVGVLLATHIHEREGYTLILDVGTNGEIVLSGKGEVLTCSTAAGPAFEGAHIRWGMRAAEGAIEEVNIHNGQGICQYKVIGSEKPKGICGSGIIDAVAALYQNGIIDYFGAFCHPEDLNHLHDNVKSRIRKGAHGMEFVLAKAEETTKGVDIVICQKDIRELQMGKAAIYGGIQILLKEMGIASEDLSEILIAGAFGSYIRRESAETIGLFPKLSKEKVKSIGNAASEGGRLALISQNERELAANLAKKCRHIELSGYDDFQNEYMEAINFPKI